MKRLMRIRLRPRPPRENESGQALVEFAIVTPLIVLVILFALWFYELVQIKLKVQEAARYASWEATAYPLHDYRFGRARLGQLATTFTVRSNAEAILRYGDMDSSTLIPLSRRHLAASWTPPLIFTINQQEDAIYGGPLVNFLFGLGATIFDVISSLNFSSTNYVAQSLIASGRNYGGARTARMFGSPEWGFNKRGYMRSQVAVMVSNQWFGSGLGRLLMPNSSVLLTEHNGVLADSWRLNDQAFTYGGLTRPGYAPQSKLYRQIDRMYFVNRRTRNVARIWVQTFHTLATIAYGLTFSTGSTPQVNDFLRPAVVSLPYRNAQAGKSIVRQDLPPIGRYDSAPHRQEYQKTLRQRGNNFMGCRQAMKLGCTDTLSQDNPFGDYLVRPK